MKRLILKLCLLTVILLTLIPTFALAQKSRTLILGAYTVPKEAYQQEVIPAFQKFWKAKTGEDVKFEESYTASGAQARAIIGGFEADVAALSLEGDLQKVVEAGLINHNWKIGPQKGMVTNSVVAIGYRPGNPKQIKDWEDLAKPGVEVIYPNPKTSGGAMWGVNAIYGAGLKISEAKGKKDPVYAANLLKGIQKNVKVMDKSGRESVTTFERGIGDAIVTYENEVLLRQKEGKNFPFIVPKSTILIENPTAIVDKYVDKHGTRDLAEAFVDFCFTEAAQRSFAKFGLRPVLPKIADEFKDKFPQPELLFDVSYLGGWPQIEKDIYGPSGVWIKILEDLATGK
ncbi:MAG: sulfate ABC transporter substrate-binding protein [bacterium]|nr:sulfate ABC transporter substrate-binding protein [bacterium]